ncbi:MAG TPA: hypothetical protein EYP14_15620 [Planctomycetaceae bacterium]|nr:hypothetical protein [Planctomycetaceae bacterium]
MRRLRGRLIGLVTIALAVAPGFGHAQRSRTEDRTRVPKTEVCVELLAEGGVAAGLAAQQWGRIFQQLGVPLRIRRPLLDDKPELKERQFGTIRRVTAVGRLQRTGRITFPDRSFTLRDRNLLKEWLRELQTYGAQGSPEGKPAFGLSPKQFQQVFQALTPQLEVDVHGRGLQDALTALPLPDAFPVHLSVAAKDLVRRTGDGRCSQHLKGLSLGTAFSALLNDFGLGFRPSRTPSGRIELRVEPLEEGHDHWPIGWELPEDVSRLELARDFFKLRLLEYRDEPLPDLLRTVSAASGIPILVDTHQLRKEGIALSRLRVEFPRRQASWSLLLRAATTPHKLTRRLRLDEAGRLLVWITSLRKSLKERQMKGIRHPGR